MSTKITILGSGAMATACSILLSDHADQDVAIWARNPDHARDMDRNRENKRLLPGVAIPSNVQIHAEIDKAVEDAEYLVAAIPTKFLRIALSGIAPSLQNGRPVVSVIKGMEIDSYMRPSEIICDVLGKRPVVVLGGPSHAEEIARAMPASVVAASDDLALAKKVQNIFSTDRFRVYTNQDIVGVELGGALKNVIAIAAGICDGLQYGDNAKSALLTRGIVEMTRFGTVMGSEATTFQGLAGVGDLITTCFSQFSRNRKVGERLGRGESLNEIVSSMESVAEGVTTTKSVYRLASKKGIEMPITREVFRVLFEQKPPEEATNSLMMRPPREE